MIYLLLVIVVGFVLWRFRAPILAKVLGQPQSRIDRQIQRRKK